MLNVADKIPVRELVHELLPKLQATEELVHSTLGELIRLADSEDLRAHRKNQQIEFELEISMIRMNLDHLMQRYAAEIKEALETTGSRADVTLKLDQHERFAIESARKLYERARDLQGA